MSKYIVLYNPAAQKNRGLENARKIENQVTGACVYQDMTEEGFSFAELVKKADPDEKIVITGGDGTLNHFLNTLPDVKLPRGLYFFPGGSGNDFVRDLDLPKDCGPIFLNPYLEDLPVVTVGDRKFRFFNGVGVGLDGFCCAEKERLTARGIERSYSKIALLALLRDYHTCDAEITVDGVKKEYKKVWMAPSMFGRYFGGGVMAAPGQKRDDPDHMLTSVIVHDSGKIWALIMFLLFCKGRGKIFPRHIEERRGYDIHVKLSAVSDVQVDGETVAGMTEYRAVAKRPEEREKA